MESSDPILFCTSPGSILAMLQLRAKTKSLTCPPLSIARYSFIQLSQLGRKWRERKCPIFETVAKGDSNPGSLDCESGILPLSYRAPLEWPRKECSILYRYGKTEESPKRVQPSAPDESILTELGTTRQLPGFVVDVYVANSPSLDTPSETAGASW